MDWGVQVKAVLWVGIGIGVCKRWASAIVYVYKGWASAIVYVKGGHAYCMGDDGS